MRRNLRLVVGTLIGGGVIGLLFASPEPVRIVALPDGSATALPRIPWAVTLTVGSSKNVACASDRRNGTVLPVRRAGGTHAETGNNANVLKGASGDPRRRAHPARPSGHLIIRTGIDCKDLGLSPGFYTNATIEWDLRTDTARVVEVANWAGGSYGDGKPLPAY